jgi:hypothetical protein
VDPTFAPDFDTPHAPGGIPVSTALEGIFLRSTRWSVKHHVPKQLANWLRRLRAQTMRQPPRLPAELRKQLTASFRDDIAKTSQLIGRSLEHWL